MDRRLLTTEQLEDLEREGYLVVDDVVDPALVEGMLNACERIAHDLVKPRVEAGDIPAEVAILPFDKQVIWLTRQSGRSYAQYFDISLPTAGDVTERTPINLADEFFQTLRSPALLDVVSSVIGDEITANPTQHIRLKMPLDAVPEGSTGMVGTTPWHQDNGVLLPEADDTDVITVWTPLTRSTIQNGALRVIPGTHKLDLVAHCPGGAGYAIPDKIVKDMPAPQVLEMDPGSVLVMFRRTIHDSLPNQTRDELRISLDLRFQPTGQPTGRDKFPSFVLRSASSPGSETTSAAEWARAWRHARSAMASPESDQTDFYRWGDGGDMCA